MMTTEQLHAKATPAEVADEVSPATTPPVATPVPVGGLTVGSAGDPAEAAADAMADRAISRLRRHTSPDVDQHQHGPGCEHIRRSPSAGGGTPTVGLAGGPLDGDTSAQINARRGRGSALPGPVLGRMETAFGRSFSDVRIHTDSNAAVLNRSISANAFTTGKDIFFGQGQFQPDSAGGEHVLAHELAHVVQGDGVVQRWPWTKDDPAAIAEKEAKKLREQQLKEQKKQDKADEKAASAKMKADEKAHKTLEATTRDNQKKDRAQGMATRKGMSDDIKAEQTDGKVTSDKANDLNRQFAQALEKEADLFALLSLQLDEDKARDQAYQQVWLKDASPELKAVRPPRETAAERLTSAVRKERTENNVQSGSEEAGKLGTMLSKKVEKVYEEAEQEYDRILAAGGKTEEECRSEVERNIWDKVPQEIRDKRPTETQVEQQARDDARKRLKLRPTPPPVEKDRLEQGIAGGEIAGKVVGAVGLAGKPASMGLKQAGKPKDEAIEKNLGIESESEGSIIEKAGPLGSVIKQSREAKEQKAKGIRSKPEDKTPKSDETKAAAGIGAVTNILSGLVGTVTNIMKAAKSISKAHTERSARNVLAATKAATDATKAAADTAKSAAEFAKILDTGVVDAVASFIPGLNIGIAALGLISNGTTLADMSMRMNDVNNSLFEARTRGKGASDQPDVMVYPLLKMEATYTKKVEQASWDTGVSVSELATSIATVASAGGFGIPTAVQAGVKLVDLLHKLGHFIADNVLAVITQKSRVAALQSLEGSAEDQLEKDPAMAVDAIIMSAKKGDAVAIQFLAGYEINDAKLNSEKMVDLRAAILEKVGEDADPMTSYQKFKSVAGGVVGAVKGVGQKWSDVSTMADQRNEAGNKGKTDRGLRWKLKMMFKGDAKFKRSLKKTSTYADVQPTAAPVERGTICLIGPLALPEDPTDQEMDVFFDLAEKLDLAALQKALAHKRNAGDEAQQILLSLIQHKTADEAAKAGSTP